MKREMPRREFLRLLGAAIAGFLAGCAPRTPGTPPASPLPESTATGVPPTVAATATLSPTRPTSTTAPTQTSTPAATQAPPTETPTPEATAEPTATEPPAPTATATLAPTATPLPGPQVAIARAASYDRTLVRQQVQTLLDELGGLGDVVRPGARVAIKVNLTGGNNFQPPAGYSAVDCYMTHPEVVRALGELLYEAGASQLFIVEALFDAESFSQNGYADVANDLGASLVDLNNPAPYDSFARFPVGSHWSIYQELTLNRLLQDVDTFVSVAKLKCHFSCGVTLAIKNLIGLLPISEYRAGPDDWWRSAAHGTSEELVTRLPRVVTDLALARPIDLALIDGILTAEGGEVPRGSFSPVAPGVLLAGKNALATDAVATAVMGFDPTVEYPSAPFLHADNHLNLAAGAGLGTNRLPEIHVVGAPIEDVLFPFHPSDREARVPWHHLPGRWS